MSASPPTPLPLVMVAAERAITDSIAEAFAAQGLRVGPAGDPPWESALGAVGGGAAGPAALLVDARDHDMTAFLAEGARIGWIGQQGLVVALVERAPAPEQYRDWLRAGLWDIERLPVDAELLALRLGNVLGARPGRDAVVRIPTPPRHAYHWAMLVRVTEETRTLADRYGRPLACVAFRPEWDQDLDDERAREILERLADAARARVRGSDIVGLSREGMLLTVLPDTDRPGAAVFTGRMLQFLETRLQELDVRGRIRSGLALVSDEGYRDAEELLTASSRGLT